eukprot:684304-Pyramimonas_sp.AAC.1
MRQRFRKVRALRRRFKGPKETPFTKVTRQGVAPACSFGAEVLGLTASEWLSLRRLMARSTGPSHGGVSLRAKVALFGDSSGRLAMAPAIQWCRMIWTATRRPALPQGPIARAVLCLRRAGWRADGPLKWFDHSGLEVELETTPPAPPHGHDGVRPGEAP